MFKLLTKIPRKINLAFSGGVDSLAAAHFLKRGKHDLTLLHFNHGCQYSDEIERQCRERAESLSVPIIVGRMPEGSPNKGQSLEDFWRRARYRFLRSFPEQFITCHHLDDAIESSIMSLLNNGVSTLIPVKDDKVLRPFLITKKSELQSYAKRHGLIEVPDPYNEDLRRQRNYIRKNVIPHILHTHPGYYKVITKRYLNERAIETNKGAA